MELRRIISYSAVIVYCLVVIFALPATVGGVQYFTKPGWVSVKPAYEFHYWAFFGCLIGFVVFLIIEIIDKDDYELFFEGFIVSYIVICCIALISCFIKIIMYLANKLNTYSSNESMILYPLSIFILLVFLTFELIMHNVFEDK